MLLQYAEPFAAFKFEYLEIIRRLKSNSFNPHSRRKLCN